MEPHTHDEDGEAELEPYFDRYDAEGNVVTVARRVAFGCA